MCASKRGILSVNLAQFYLGSVPLFACVGSLVTIRCYSLNESTEINIQRQKKRVKSRAGDSSLDRLQIRSRFSLWIESVSRSRRDVPALRFHSQIRSVTPVHQLYSASYSCRSRSGSFTVSTSAVSVWVVVEEGFTRLIASSDDAPSLPPLPACKCVRVSVPLSRLIHRDALSFLSSFLFSLQLVSVCLSFLSFYPPSVHLSRFFTCVLYVFNLIHSNALSLSLLPPLPDDVAQCSGARLAVGCLSSIVRFRKNSQSIFGSQWRPYLDLIYFCKTTEFETLNFFRSNFTLYLVRTS